MNLVDEFNTDEERIGQIEDQSEKIIQNKSWREGLMDNI